MMKPGTIVALAVVAVIAVTAIAVAAWVYLRPLSVYEWMGRRTLRNAGLARVEVDTPAGRQVAFAGGHGPVVVLLHGAGDQAGTWSRVAPRLAGSYSLIVPDLAGHGDSAPHAGPIDVPRILDGAEAVIQRLAAGKRVTIVGNSLGAWVAMLVAYRHPEWVERVVAVNGGAITGRNEAVRIVPTSVAEAREAMSQLRDPASAPVPDFVLRDVVRHATAGSLARFAGTAGAMGAWTLDGKLGGIRPPVVLLWGASDRVMPLDYARRMLAELPDARLVTLERCGHVPQQECPTAFLAALRGALEGIE
jgi:pimeloyl-ACP methyl ester carboxylesterase